MQALGREFCMFHASLANTDYVRACGEAGASSSSSSSPLSGSDLYRLLTFLVAFSTLVFLFSKSFPRHSHPSIPFSGSSPSM